MLTKVEERRGILSYQKKKKNLIIKLGGKKIDRYTKKKEQVYDTRWEDNLTSRITREQSKFMKLANVKGKIFMCSLEVMWICVFPLQFCRILFRSPTC